MFRRISIHALLIVLVAIYSIPIFWMISTSLKQGVDVFKVPLEWLPNPVKAENFRLVFETNPFFKYMGNTFFISILSCLGEIIICPLAAYSLSKIDWAGRKYIFPLLLGTLMLPWTVTMVPTYIIWSKLGFVGTMVPLILPHFFGSAYLIFLLRQFLRTVPKEMSEAACVDGASEFRIYRQVILPQMKPALATVVVLTFLASWNDYTNQLLYLTRPETYTISLGLQSFLVEKKQQWELLMAASCVASIPVIILFFFAQKQLVQGITTTGIKG